MLLNVGDNLQLESLYVDGDQIKVFSDIYHVGRFGETAKKETMMDDLSKK